MSEIKIIKKNFLTLKSMPRNSKNESDIRIKQMQTELNKDAVLSKTMSLISDKKYTLSTMKDILFYLIKQKDFGDDDYDTNNPDIPTPHKGKPSRMAIFLENQKYTWAKEGRAIITKGTISFSHKDKKILKTLLLSSIPEDLRKDVTYFYYNNI